MTCSRAPAPTAFCSPGDILESIDQKAVPEVSSALEDVLDNHVGGTVKVQVLRVDRRAAAVQHREPGLAGAAVGGDHQFADRVRRRRGRGRACRLRSVRRRRGAGAEQRQQKKYPAAQVKPPVGLGVHVSADNSRNPAGMQPPGGCSGGPITIPRARSIVEHPCAGLR